MKLDRNKIKLAMARCGYDWSDFAEKMGCTKQNIQILIARGRCTPKTVGRMAKALNCDPADIVTFDE